MALVEREALGGDCLWTGCVPTKALVASARVAHQMRHADRWGLPPVTPQIAPRDVLESMRGRRQNISRHDDPAKFRALGIDVIEGAARFRSPDELEVNGRILLAKDFVIATGARTAVPPVDGLEEAGYLDHASFLAQDAFPRSVLIVGGGAIGVEFAQLFARFGTRVTLVEPLPTILGKEDAGAAQRIHRILESEGVEILTGWSLAAVRREDSGRSATIVRHDSGESRIVRVDDVFVAAGRRGNSDGLGLDAAGVAVERSWVVTDRYLRTTAPRIWACGDIHGGLQFTHVAAFEAVKLVRNILFPGKSAVDYANVPWAIYTDPEIARVGLTEAEAREQHGEGVRVYEVEMHDVDRAVVDRADAGFLKLICDARGRILGAHAVCSNASSVIQEAVLARRKGMKVAELAQRISPYPSLADGMQKAASQYYQSIAAGPLGALARTLARWSQ